LCLAGGTDHAYGGHVAIAGKVSVQAICVTGTDVRGALWTKHNGGGRRRAFCLFCRFRMAGDQRYCNAGCINKRCNRHTGERDVTVDLTTEAAGGGCDISFGAGL
jgi:hypothetical protein